MPVITNVEAARRERLMTEAERLFNAQVEKLEDEYPNLEFIVDYDNETEVHFLGTGSLSPVYYAEDGDVFNLVESSACLLDECYEPVEIASATYAPSEITMKCNPRHFQAIMDDEVSFMLDDERAVEGDCIQTIYKRLEAESVDNMVAATAAR